MGILEALRAPGNYLRGVVGGQPGTQLSPEELLQNWGVQDPHWLASMGVDLFTDPMNYLVAGAGAGAGALGSARLANTSKLAGPRYDAMKHAVDMAAKRGRGNSVTEAMELQHILEEPALMRALSDIPDEAVPFGMGATATAFADPAFATAMRSGSPDPPPGKVFRLSDFTRAGAQHEGGGAWLDDLPSGKAWKRGPRKDIPTDQWEDHWTDLKTLQKSLDNPGPPVDPDLTGPMFPDDIGHNTIELNRLLNRDPQAWLEDAAPRHPLFADIDKETMYGMSTSRPQARVDQMPWVNTIKSMFPWSDNLNPPGVQDYIQDLASQNLKTFDIQGHNLGRALDGRRVVLDTGGMRRIDPSQPIPWTTGPVDMVHLDKMPHPSEVTLSDLLGYKDYARGGEAPHARTILGGAALGGTGYMLAKQFPWLRERR